MLQTDYNHKIILNQEIEFPLEVLNDLKKTEIHNYRDVAVSIGGLMRMNNDDSYVILKSNKLFRSTELCSLNTSQLKLLVDCGVKDIIDLRAEDEVLGIKSEKELIPEGINYHFLPIDTKVSELAYEDLQKTMDDDIIPEIKQNNYNNFKKSDTSSQTDDITSGTVKWDNKLIDKSEFLYYGYASMRKMYSRFVTDEIARMQFGKALKIVAASKSGVLIHCRSGKDRTGWLVALLLFICDVDPELIMQDYMLSASSENEAANALEEEFKIGDKQMFLPFATVYPSYIREAMREVLKLAKKHNIISNSGGQTSIDTWKKAINYYLESCGITEKDINDIRENLLSNNNL